MQAQLLYKERASAMALGNGWIWQGKGLRRTLSRLTHQLMQVSAASVAI